MGVKASGILEWKKEIHTQLSLQLSKKRECDWMIEKTSYRQLSRYYLDIIHTWTNCFRTHRRFRDGKHSLMGRTMNLTTKGRGGGANLSSSATCHLAIIDYLLSIYLYHLCIFDISIYLSLIYHLLI